MKKSLVFFLILLNTFINTFGVFSKELIISYDGSAQKYTGTICSLKVNNENIVSDMPPIILDNRSLVPVRAVFEKLGASVEWDSQKKQVGVSYNNSAILLNINDKIALINGKEVEMEVPAKIINDRTMVPLRFVGEHLSMNVGWDNNTKEISINNTPSTLNGSLTGVQYTKADNEHKVTINLKDYENYNIMRLPKPDRIVVDFPNTKVLSVSDNINVDSNVIKAIRCGQFENSTARVVLDVIGQPEYGIVHDKSKLILSIKDDTKVDTENKMDVSYVSQREYDKITIKTKNYAGYNSFTLSDPYRIVLDIPGNYTDEPKEVRVNSSFMSNIRYANNGTKGARIVIDGINTPVYKLVEELGALVIYVAKSLDSIRHDSPSRGDSIGSDNQVSVGYFNKESHEEVLITLRNYSGYDLKKHLDQNRLILDIPDSYSPKEEQRLELNGEVVGALRYSAYDNNSTRIIMEMKKGYEYEVQEDTGKLILRIVPSDKEQNVENGNNNTELPKDILEEPVKLKIGYEKASNMDKIVLNTNNADTFNIWRLTGTNRVVMDIPKALVDSREGSFDVNGIFIKKIRYSQYEKETVRIVADVNGQPHFEVVKSGDKIEIQVIKPTYKNITYSNNADRVTFTLKGAKLTEGGEFLKKLYTEKYENDGKKYTITFSNDLADLGTGNFVINDTRLHNVNITKDSSTNKTTMVFNAKEDYVFEINTRSYVSDTAITLLKRATKDDRLVVIDPGHGGSEPGAVYDGINEKDLNLDIAKRLNELLKSNNVKTYMIREDDSYISLYERAYIANSLNASLFLSIHNNAYYTKHKGTETLYYPSKVSTGLTGKKFAQIIQDDLVSTLKTTNRGIIERPNLVVLKATKMPAALAEVAFMTNSDDMSKLKSESFRQKAAEAMCRSILKALAELN